MIEIRREPPDGPAGRALFAAYLDLVRERLPGYTPTEAIHGSEAELEEWLVLYEDGAPVGCGGLRAGEIKRMYVRPEARRRGHGRRLLAELEARAAAAGHRRARLYTTDVLTEALHLYSQAGYVLVETVELEGRRDHWLEKEIA